MFYCPILVKYSFATCSYVRDVRFSDVTALTVLLDGEGHGLVIKLVVSVCQDDAPHTEGGIRRQR